MKIIATKLLFVTVTIFLLIGCKKIGKTYDAYFYTGIETTNGNLILELDNKIMGQVPLIKTTLSADNDTIINQALHLKLRASKYKISVRDNLGNVKCSGVLYNSFNGATNPGALEHALTKNILVTRIHF